MTKQDRMLISQQTHCQGFAKIIRPGLVTKFGVEFNTTHTPHLAGIWVAANKRPMDYYAGTKGRKYNTRSETYGCRQPNQYIGSV